MINLFLSVEYWTYDGHEPCLEIDSEVTSEVSSVSCKFRVWKYWLIFGDNFEGS